MTNASKPEDAVLLFTFAAPNPAEPESLGIYAKRSLELAGSIGANPMVRGPVLAHPVGETPAGIVGIAQFSSAAAVDDLFDRNPEYRALVPHRKKAFTALNVYLGKPGDRIESLPDAGVLLTTVVRPNPEGGRALAEYSAGAKLAAGQAGARPIGRFPLTRQVMGEGGGRMVSLAVFPDESAISAMFESADYQKLVGARRQAFDAVDAYAIAL